MKKQIKHIILFSLTIINLTAIYLVTLIFFLPKIVPNLGVKERVQKRKIPENLQQTIQRMHEESRSNREYLEKVYGYIVSNYSGNRLKTLTRFWYAWQDPLTHTSGYLPCTSLNYLMRVMLITSGRFRESDIKQKTITFPKRIFLHQYLDVRIEGVWVHVDPWAHFLGVQLGERLENWY